MNLLQSTAGFLYCQQQSPRKNKAPLSTREEVLLARTRSDRLERPPPETLLDPSAGPRGCLESTQRDSFLFDETV